METALSKPLSTKFTKRVQDILSQTHYTFLKDIAGHSYENKFCWSFAGMMAILAPNKKQNLKDLNREKLISLLQQKNIRKICEVGPGTPAESMLYPLAPLLQEAGCEISVMASDLSEFTRDNYAEEGITIIRKEAGKVQDPTLSFDIVIAHNVFSLGGQLTAGRWNDNPEEIIAAIEKGVLDIVQSMSTNPCASIILTEQYDILPIDRSVMNVHMNILSWHALQTDNGWLYKNQEHFSAQVRQIYNDAPNFIVLQKK